VLEGHSHNLSAVCFHPELPILVTAAEDGSVRLWHALTVREEEKKRGARVGFFRGRHFFSASCLLVSSAPFCFVRAPRPTMTGDMSARRTNKAPFATHARARANETKPEHQIKTRNEPKKTSKKINKKLSSVAPRKHAVAWPRARVEPLRLARQQRSGRGLRRGRGGAQGARGLPFMLVAVLLSQGAERARKRE